MTCNARKTLWMALYARELKTEIVKIRSWSAVENCGVKHSELEKVSKIEKNFEGVFLGPKRGYDTYLLSYKDAVLTGPNKSIWSNYKGLEVEIMSFALKDDFTIFPFWHAPQSASEW